MGETLTIVYDGIGDILSIDVCPPYAEQDSDEIGESLVARFNLETGEIETIEVLFFFSWIKKAAEIRIPINAALWPAYAAPANAIGLPFMDSTFTIRYGPASDTLTLEQRPPHPGQREADISKDTTARLNRETGEIERLEIRRFKARVDRDGEIVLPVNATLRPARHPVSAE